MVWVKTMKLLDEYLAIQKQIYEYFGYVEDWVIIPIDDVRQYFWYEDGENVYFAESERELLDKDGEYYMNTIYTPRFLPKWIYPADDYTMICVDTHVDGNKFLQIFDNAKRVDC